ncbi:MAG: hypothetical protein WCM93_17265, partial [Bacteroidota bacterium]
ILAAQLRCGRRWPESDCAPRLPGVRSCLQFRSLEERRGALPRLRRVFGRGGRASSNLRTNGLS